MHLSYPITKFALVLCFVCFSISNGASTSKGNKRKRTLETNCELEDNCIFRNGISYLFKPHATEKDIFNIFVKKNIKDKLANRPSNNITIYTTLYNSRRRLPVYSAYVFDSINTRVDFMRADDWRQTFSLLPNYDLRLATDDTYSNGNKNKQRKDKYHRGHLMPYIDYYYESAKDTAFVTDTYFNAAPQVGAQNSGIWRTIEERVRELMVKKNNGTVVTGVCDKASDYLNENTQDLLEVPKCFWKLVCFRNKTDNTVFVFGFKVMNEIVPGVQSCSTAMKSQSEIFSGVDYFLGKAKANFWFDVYSKLDIEARPSYISLPTHEECANAHDFHSTKFKRDYCKRKYKPQKSDLKPTTTQIPESW